MRITAHVEMHGLPEKLSVFAHSLEDFNPVWRDVADDFETVEKARFASNGGGTWAPWGPLYREWDDPRTGNRFSSTSPLHRTGGLERSLTTDETILEQSAKHLVLGTRYHAQSNAGKDVPVAELIDKGFTAKGRISVRRGRGYARPKIRVAVPGRKLIDITAADHERWRLIADRWVSSMRRRAGL